MTLDSLTSIRNAGPLTVAAALAELRDVAGISGCFVFDSAGHLVARDIHALFDDKWLGETAEQLTRLRETLAAGGDELDLAVVRFEDRKLYLKVLPGGMLCILADGVVNMPALRMAAHLVGRKIAPELKRADPLTVHRPKPAESAAPSALADQAPRSRPR